VASFDSILHVPLVLVESEVALSGHEYDDLTGLSYQYPPVYRNKIAFGERFVYYQSRRLKSGGTRPQGYFGTGIIGDVHERVGTTQLRCDIVDYTPFAQLVSFRDDNGVYRERGAEGKPNYWRAGVRQIDDDTFNRIIDAAATGKPQPVNATTSKYSADADRAQEIEQFAVSATKMHLRKRYTSARIIEMPRNNPGYTYGRACIERGRLC
jgi:hypothetical protein